ncbi:MAG: DUF1127 domain-containing protein [Rhizobiaceae bacterium]|nr:DUF1127 domain-containing protein [Rhizobiaceae bacterium]
MITLSRISSPRPAVRFAGSLRLEPLSLLARWYDRHLQRRVLAELDARMLADIGLTPNEAAREARKPFWR